MTAPSFVIEQWQNKSGLTHRIGGPAIVYSDGHKRWFLWGIEYSIEEYLCKLQELNYQKEVEQMLWTLAD